MFAEDNKRFDRSVVCAWCGNKHRSVFPDDMDEDGTQGDACASSVFLVTEQIAKNFAESGAKGVEVGDWMVKSNYGSNLDTSVYRWVRNKPSRAADPICDNCIGERRKAGDLVHVEGHYP